MFYGVSTITDRQFSTLISIDNSSQPVSAPTTQPMVALGAEHTCYLNSVGEVRCWGGNWTGQLGYNDTTDRGGTAGSMTGLSAVSLGQSATAISSSAYHTCALLVDGGVKCWGYNDRGQLGYDHTLTLGDGPNELNNLTAVDLGLPATQIAVGEGHTCALLNDGHIKCWGSNMFGQLGYNDTTDRGNSVGSMAALAAINLGQTAKEITAGGQFTCAVLADDSLKCWGRNHVGQLGYEDTNHRGDTVGSIEALTAVQLGASVSHVSAHNYHVCAVLTNHNVKCWGANSNGQLGYNDTADRGGSINDMSNLASINLGKNAVTVSTGNYHSCAIFDDGTAKCWGNNNWGQLGYDDSNSRGDSVGSMASLGLVLISPVISQMALGEIHSCAILAAGVKCWGHNSGGRLGYNDTTNRGDFTGSMAALNYVQF